MWGSGDLIEAEAIIRGAIEAWSELEQLADFAEKGYGFGNSDGGFGVTYAADLDDYDREVDGVQIGPGKVQVYAFWGSPDGFEVEVDESFYLEILLGEFKERGLLDAAARVENLLSEQRSNNSP